MLVLKFDAQKFAYDLIKYLIIGADKAMEHFISDAQSHLKYSKEDYDKIDAYYDIASEKIIAKCKFYALAIIESFGTGSKMDTTNPDLAAYMNSIYWNPDRRRFAIAGRKKGTYTNIFGETVTSSGKYRGKEIENIVPARAPSHAIQNAERKLDAGLKDGGYVMRALQKQVDDFFAHFNPTDYFYNEEMNV